MLVVTVELWSFGNESKKQHLDTAFIANDGSGDRQAGNYVATFSKWGRPKQVWKRSIVKGFPRLVRGPWDLLFCALRQAVETRNPDGGF